MTDPTLADRVAELLCDCDRESPRSNDGHWSSCAAIVPQAAAILALVKAECERVLNVASATILHGLNAGWSAEEIVTEIKESSK